jgi:Ca2+-binding EF-hand superfamily protein
MSQINRVQNCFELLDDNKDGVISKDELENAVKVLAVGKEKNIEKTVDCIMQLVDTDNSETIDFDEFSKVFSEICVNKPKESELKKIFKLFDKGKMFFTSNRCFF